MGILAKHSHNLHSLVLMGILAKHSHNLHSLVLTVALNLIASFSGDILVPLGATNVIHLAEETTKMLFASRRAVYNFSVKHLLLHWKREYNLDL